MLHVQSPPNKLSNNKYLLNRNVNVKEAINKTLFERGLSKMSKIKF